MVTSAQDSLWNGAAGNAWVDAQELLDSLFRPLEELLVELAGEGRSVLDIGCGTGATTVAVARKLAGAGRCVGIDISEPMLAAARARAARDGVQVSFVQGDAQVYSFEPAGFDTLISRFGVMSFEDPVAAFCNLHHAAKDGAALHMAVWRSPEENPFMIAAEHAAASFLPNLPPRVPGAPGQFAFADERLVRRILENSGWTDIAIQPFDFDCAFPETALMSYALRLGPVGRALQEPLDDLTRTRVVEAVRTAFQPYVQGAAVRFSAACWMVRCSRPTAAASRCLPARPRR